MTVSPVDVTSAGLYRSGIPHDRFRAMRETSGLTWHPYESTGFWAVTRHADVRAVSASPEVFSSAIGHTNLWDLEADALEARRSIIDTDAPDHTRLRRLVSAAFTPRSIHRWEAATRHIVGEHLDNFVASGGGDWVQLVAAPIPIRVILSILGVPTEDADFLVELSNYLVEGTSDQPTLAPDAYGNVTPLRLLPFASPASHALFDYGERMGQLRRSEPGDDLLTTLVSAQDDTDRLSPSEFRNFFHLLVFAGNETTRTALIHGALAFSANPDQWDRVIADPRTIETAVEEVLRWATPVLHMRRTATQATDLAGTAIAAGDKVVMWYASANRDPDAFAEPFTFDVSRTDNPHFAFGGGGHHFCLGASLARMETRILLEEMAHRNLRLDRIGDPVHAPSNFVHGVLSVDMAVTQR
jgi:cytochrome P450